MLQLTGELSGYRHVIWDMNGTLIDDAELCVLAVNPILRQFALPEIDVEIYRKRFKFPVYDYYKDLGFRISKEEFAELSHVFHDHYLRLLPTAKVFDGTRELLSGLREEGKTLSVLTAAWQEDLDRVLGHFELKEHFHHFYGLNHREADSKIQRGHELMQAAGVPASETVLIGDTLHDFEVGEALGIDTILLTEGHMDSERLATTSAKIVRRESSSAE